MKDAFRHGLLAFVIGWLGTGCAGTQSISPGSLAYIEQEQQTELLIACTNYVYGQNLHRIMAPGAVTTTCRDWAHARYNAPRKVLVQISRSNGFN